MFNSADKLLWTSMSDEEEIKKINMNELPWFYKLILKIPGANFLGGITSGIFWSIVVPIFLVFEFFISMFLLLLFPFPTNIVLASVIPTAVFIMFVRISLERFINYWNSAVAKTGYEWNVEKTMREYLATLEKRKREKE